MKKCGCKYKQIPKGLTFVWAIVYCPMHEAAPELLAVVKMLIEQPDEYRLAPFQIEKYAKLIAKADRKEGQKYV